MNNIKNVYNILDLSVISPTQITSPNTPYYEWLSDFYTVLVKKSVPVDPHQPTINLYYYVDSENKFYTDPNNNIYTSYDA